jgi:predicted lipoprotein with Yx(FWY)xxD motif
MTRSRPITFLAGAAAMKISSGASATVGVANNSLGSILVDSTGRTLYLFKAESGIKSACATAWPAAAVERHAGQPTSSPSRRSTEQRAAVYRRQRWARGEHALRPCK